MKACINDTQQVFDEKLEKQWSIVCEVRVCSDEGDEGNGQDNGIVLLELSCKYIYMHIKTMRGVVSVRQFKIALPRRVLQTNDVSVRQLDCLTDT